MKWTLLLIILERSGYFTNIWGKFSSNSAKKDYLFLFGFVTNPLLNTYATEITWAHASNYVPLVNRNTGRLQKCFTLLDWLNLQITGLKRHPGQTWKWTWNAITLWFCNARFVLFDVTANSTAYGATDRSWTLNELQTRVYRWFTLTVSSFHTATKRFHNNYKVN